MKHKILFIAASCFLLSACLKNDILKDELLDASNINETDHITSGAIMAKFDVNVLSSELTPFVNSDGDTVCATSFSIQLSSEFINDLKNYWDGYINLERTSGSAAPVTTVYELKDDWSKPFEYKAGAVPCDTNETRGSLTLKLIDPNTSRVTAVAGSKGFDLPIN